MNYFMPLSIGSAWRKRCAMGLKDFGYIVKCREHRDMPEWLSLLLFVLGYVVLMKWVLPRFGVPS